MFESEQYSAYEGNVPISVFLTEELSEFANFHGNRVELSNTLLKVSDNLRDLNIKEPQKQTPT